MTTTVKLKPAHNTYPESSSPPPPLAGRGGGRWGLRPAGVMELLHLSLEILHQVQVLLQLVAMLRGRGGGHGMRGEGGHGMRGEGGHGMRGWTRGMRGEGGTWDEGREGTWDEGHRVRGESAWVRRGQGVWRVRGGV